MYKGLYTILITINIVTTIAIGLFCFVFLWAIRLSFLLLSNVTLIK